MADKIRPHSYQVSHRFKGAVIAPSSVDPCDANNVVITSSHFIDGEGEAAEVMICPRPVL